jgi:hypothetical protein
MFEPKPPATAATGWSGSVVRRASQYGISSAKRPTDRVHQKCAFFLVWHQELSRIDALDRGTSMSSPPPRFSPAGTVSASEAASAASNTQFGLFVALCRGRSVTLGHKIGVAPNLAGVSPASTSSKRSRRGSVANSRQTSCRRNRRGEPLYRSQVARRGVILPRCPWRCRRQAQAWRTVGPRSGDCRAASRRIRIAAKAQAGPGRCTLLPRRCGA